MQQRVAVWPVSQRPVHSPPCPDPPVCHLRRPFSACTGILVYVVEAPEGRELTYAPNGCVLGEDFWAFRGPQGSSIPTPWTGAILPWTGKEFLKKETV